MRGLQKILGLREQFLRSFLGQVLQKALWADACPVGEYPLKVEFAQPNLRCDLRQAWLFPIMIFKVQDGLLDTQVILGKLFETGERGIHRFSFLLGSFYETLSCRATRFLLTFHDLSTTS